MGIRYQAERIEKELGSVNDALLILEMENGNEIDPEDKDDEKKIFDAQPAIRVLKDHAYKLRRKL